MAVSIGVFVFLLARMAFVSDTTAGVMQILQPWKQRILLGPFKGNAILLDHDTVKLWFWVQLTLIFKSTIILSKP